MDNIITIVWMGALLYCVLKLIYWFNNPKLSAPKSRTKSDEWDEIIRKLDYILSEQMKRMDVGIVERLLARYPGLRDKYNERYPKDSLSIKSGEPTSINGSDKPNPPSP